jgi:hypothetical protein
MYVVGALTIFEINFCMHLDDYFEKKEKKNGIAD